MYRRTSARISFVFVLGLVLASVSEAALVGWWRFNDGSGTTAMDSSDSGCDGTVYNPLWVEGKYDGALNFTGTNYVDVPAECWSTIDSQVTVCFWAYGDPAQQPQSNFIFGAFQDASNNESRVMSAHLPWGDGTVYFDTGGTTAGGFDRISKAGNVANYEGTWTFWTLLKNADTGDQQIYINGALWHSGTGMVRRMTGVSKFTIGTKPSLAEGWYRGMIDDFRLYDEALSLEEIQEAMTGRGPSTELAAKPVPANEATDVVHDTTLSWKAGEFAVAHDVYLGTVFDDVNDAGRDNPMGVLVSEGQEETTFDTVRLDFGQVYYWRIDEVNAAPDSTVFRGKVWSFTTETYSYPVPGARIMATASGSISGMGPGKTIDGSGLDANGRHSTKSDTMWFSAGTAPRWIQYAFDKSYVLDRLLVWNANLGVESYAGFGAKQVTVECSLDGQTWAQVEGVPEFAQGPGAEGYAANTTVAFNGVVAKYVRLTINSTWGNPQTCLSEVRFFYVPLAAYAPSPEDGEADVAPQTTLGWRAGREAASHQLFFGTDVNSLPLVATLDDPAYDVTLNLGETYFWKVVEVNEAEATPQRDGEVWSFSTLAALVVDGFESYGDDQDAGDAIFQTWTDGYEVDENGSIVGLKDAVGGTFSEMTIVHNGTQSMPFFYDNSDAAYAEAARTFDTEQDWSRAKALSLAFYGDPNNTGTMYVKINSTKVAYNGSVQDITRTQWQPWNIDLASTGVDLTSIEKLVIGIEGAGAAGTLYFDDIEIQGSAPQFITPVDPGTSGLLAWYKFDGNVKDSAGTNHGAAVGDAKTTTDATRGEVLKLDGIGDCVDVPLLGTSPALTIAMWVNTAIDPAPYELLSFFHSEGWAAGDIHWRYGYGKVDCGLYNLTNSSGTAVVKANQWNHVAVTVSATEWALWLNGYKESSMTLSTPQTMTLGDGSIGAWSGYDGLTYSRFFTGMMDDARFYNRALSQEEIGWLAGQTEPFAKPF
ncbi:MAG: discoidin domain-containing protein [Phycisphaerae bacterium]|nr:discoidin domain-containing protein [Phycisphaerae bacterium]